jgi:hypothetical protein
MGKYFQSRSPPGRLFFCRRFMPAGKMAYFDFCRSLGVICFTTSSVAENEEHDRRQRAPEERYPKSKTCAIFRAPEPSPWQPGSTQKNDENEDRPRVHLTVSTAIAILRGAKALSRRGC